MKVGFDEADDAGRQRTAPAVAGPFPQLTQDPVSNVKQVNGGRVVPLEDL